MKRSNFNTFTIVWGGVLQGKEASVRFVSETSERRSEVRLIGGDSYGC